MEKELWKKIREIEIKTSRLVSDLFGGEYRSAFKGNGLDFKEFKIYEEGDEPRHIDWKVSAKRGSLHVKRFVEERELTLLLVVDVSNSTLFGSSTQLKKELAVEFAASIAFSGLKNNDKVGMLLFSDKVLEFIPPKKGRSHILKLLKKFLSYTYKKEMAGITNIAAPLKLINKVFRKKVIVFVISDFWVENFEKELKLTASQHDLIGVIISDNRELNIPDAGLVELEDPETKIRYIFDTSDKKVKNEINALLTKENTRRAEIFRKNKIDRIFLRTNESFIVPLTNFFRLRERRF